MDKQGPEKVIALTVLAPRGQPYRGPDIAAACEALELRPAPAGLYEAYDKRSAAGETRPVLGMAHLKNPGTFDFDHLEELSTPGLLLFARLPGPLDGISTLERLATTARDLATRLGGAVCDERRNKLTQQALGRLRFEITEFERQMRVRSQAHG
ncbi:MAG: cell division protein ZipA C-terminal FtsZ-binding domain-containing protein [Candidatus Competibacteraceae bacterium]|nr:cell division protein ZipA C-terminal FtsZ-binding domain-containing protein [Candidatus Competibacteraceae bacterium]